MDVTASPSTQPVRSLYAGDPGYRELLQMYPAFMEEYRDTLCDLRERNDLQQIAGVAHQLKGSGGGFGFPGLTDAARELEEVCRQGEPDRLEAAIDGVLAYIARILAGFGISGNERAGGQPE